MTTRPTVSVVVTDLDNTLYDWFDIWYASFRPMLDELIRMSGILEQDLLPEIRQLHQKYGTSEFSRLVEELPALRRLHPDKDLFEVFAPAINAFREGRRSALRLYPTVFETLWALKKKGVLIIGYTESRAYYTNYRVRRLCLDGLLDHLHSPPDHGLPERASLAQIRRYPAEDYSLKVTSHHHTPEGELKPNPQLLLGIIESAGARPDEAIYIGDSEMKDIAMAQRAGVRDVLARYGAVQHKEQYALLQQTSHWTDEDVAREIAVKKAGSFTPNYVLQQHFAEVLEMFEFHRFAREGTQT